MSKSEYPISSPSRRRFVYLAAAAATPFAPSLLAEQSALSVTLGKHAAQPIPASYAGLSYEKVQFINPAFFSSTGHELVAIFRSLSHQGVLRISGNSSDYCCWKTRRDQPPPSSTPKYVHSSRNWMPHSYTAIGPEAVDHLADYLHASGWSTIYGLNLGTSTPDSAADEAAYVDRALGSRPLYFQIGNESDDHGQPNNRLRPPDCDFDRYFARWLTFAHAILRRVPHAQFGGPDVGSSIEWGVRFAEEAPRQLPSHIAACASHYYAEGPPPSANTPGMLNASSVSPAHKELWISHCHRPRSPLSSVSTNWHRHNLDAVRDLIYEDVTDHVHHTQATTTRNHLPVRRQLFEFDCHARDLRNDGAVAINGKSKVPEARYYSL